MFKIFRKFRVFFRSEDRKVFPIYIIAFKIIISLVIMLLLPVIFFIAFIAGEPREIPSINRYIEDKIKQLDIGDVGFENAKVSFNKKFEIVYFVSNFRCVLDNVAIKFPNIVFSIKIKDILKSNFSLHNIELRDFVGYFRYDNNNSEGYSITYDEINTIIHDTLDYFIDKKPIFSQFIINNSKFYFYDKKANNIEKINIDNSSIQIKKNGKDIKLFIDTKVTNDGKKININNNCLITKNKKVSCSTNLQNMFMLDLIKIFTRDTEINKYFENTNGVFDVNINTNFDNYTTPLKSSFIIKSKSGSVLIKEFFPNEIYYTNLQLFGSTTNDNHITLDRLNTTIGTDKTLNENNMNFKMFLDFKNKEFMKINIDIEQGKVENLNSFWPLPLDDNGIRDWVVEHFKSGDIESAFAYMDFKYLNNSFTLDKIDSNVNFNNTFLNYDNDFPPVSNLKAKAVFTVDDMNIYIDDGNIYDTKILSGKVYTDFNKPSIDIEGKTIGNAYELFYFIGNNERDKIKDIVENYVNGIATSDVKVDIPLYKDVSIDSVFVKVDSEIKENNTFIFNDNSAFKANVLKKYDSSTFTVKANLKDSIINFNNVDFVKDKKDSLDVNLDVVIENNRKILLNNIISTGVVNFSGNGVILDSYLSELNIQNVKYKNSDFTAKYLYFDNMAHLDITGEKININLNSNPLKKEKIQQNKINNTVGNLAINSFFNNVTVNEKYKIKNLSASVNFKDKFDSLSIFIDKEDERVVDVNIKKDNDEQQNKTNTNSKDYNINLELKNMGKFLSDANITDSFLFGDLYANGYIDVNKDVHVDLRIKNKFGIVTKDMKDIKFFNYILNSDLVSNKTKNKLTKENSLMFNKLSASIIYNNVDKTIQTNNFMLESDNIFGVGISGKGKFFVDTGNAKFGGVVIPANKINKLFGINNIPIVNNILFGGKDGGLFTIGYTFDKLDYNSNYEFKLVPIGASNLNSTKNLLLLLLLL